MSEKQNCAFDEAVMRVIRDNLRVESSYRGSAYGFVSNDIEFNIMLGDDVIATTTVTLEMNS